MCNCKKCTRLGTLNEQLSFWKGQKRRVAQVSGKSMHVKIKCIQATPPPNSMLRISRYWNLFTRRFRITSMPWGVCYET